MSSCEGNWELQNHTIWIVVPWYWYHVWVEQWSQQSQYKVKDKIFEKIVKLFLLKEASLCFWTHRSFQLKNWVQIHRSTYNLHATQYKIAEKKITHGASPNESDFSWKALILYLKCSEDYPARVEDIVIPSLFVVFFPFRTTDFWDCWIEIMH